MGLHDVLAHLLHEGFRPTVCHHAPEPGDKLHHYCLAVQIEVVCGLFRAVDDVGLNLAADAVEGGVGSDGDGGGPAGARPGPRASRRRCRPRG